MDTDMDKTNIRIEIFNLTLDDWKKINQITDNPLEIKLTPMELISLIGCDGGNFLSSKLNDKERLFVDEYYRIGRNLKN
jgi:hypothetical protein